MSEILLCTHNPLLIKNFYGILRDEGFSVTIADHLALAVRMVLQAHYDAAIIDAESFGLTAEETVQIMRSTSPHMPVIVVGVSRTIPDVLYIEMPVDLQEFKQTIQDIRRFGELSGKT